jgi:hypothetical protein
LAAALALTAIAQDLVELLVSTLSAVFFCFCSALP